jgi:transcriptional regulator with XRE-family HTH domain
MDDSETMRENVRLRLASLNTSLAQIAKRNGLSRARISMWITGNPTLATMGHLAGVLGVPTFELINPEFDPRQYPEPEVEGEPAEAQ